MPILPRGYQPVPYASSPRYVPSYGTLGELLGLKARNTQQGWAQLANVFNQFVENRNQQESAKATQAQREQARQDELAIKREEIAQRKAERDEADRIRREATEEKQQMQAEKRGDLRAKAIGYGPMAESDVDTVMQSPERSGDVRYSFGPGTAEGPELQPTRDQQELIDLRETVGQQGGLVTPGGSVHMPPRPAAVRPQPAMVNGRRQFVIFGQDGTAKDLGGRPVQAQPIAPDGPAPERPSVWLQKGGEQKFVTPSQAASLTSEGWGPSQVRENPSEDERKTVGFYKQMVDAIAVIDETEGQLTAKDIYQMNTVPQEDLIGMANRGEMSEAAKRYLRAFEQFTEANLRPKSGAAIGPTEYARDLRTYGKQYSETPKLNEDRKRARSVAVETLKSRAGRAMPKDDEKKDDGRVYYDADGNPIQKKPK